MDSPATSPTVAEPPSFLSPPLSDSDTHNDSPSISDARNNEPPRSCLPNRINRGIRNPLTRPTQNEALADPHWQTSMNEEMKSLKKNANWQETCGKRMSLYNKKQGQWYH
ncbi:unnamed protein product [Prunus armeniaca]